MHTHATQFCKEDLSLIENYDKAIKDTEKIWECHHRDEVKILPSGITVIRTRNELIENGRYFNCPANELIFLLPSEHKSLHLSCPRPTCKGKTSPKKGVKISEEHKNKISVAKKGMTWKLENGKRTWFKKEEV